MQSILWATLINHTNATDDTRQQLKHSLTHMFESTHFENGVEHEPYKSCLIKFDIIKTAAN